MAGRTVKGKGIAFNNNISNLWKMAENRIIKVYVQLMKRTHKSQLVTTCKNNKGFNA